MSPDCGFAVFLSIVYDLTVGSQSPGEVLSVFQCCLLCYLWSFRQKQLFYFCWALLTVTQFVFEDGIGFWGVSWIMAIRRPDGSFIHGFFSSEVLAALV
jgi:hypothetical protein